ncbi:MAG: hypothetical protein BJ554DRAFT_4419, partial [Olpidium bornovanus]
VLTDRELQEEQSASTAFADSILNNLFPGTVEAFQAVEEASDEATKEQLPAHRAIKRNSRFDDYFAQVIVRRSTVSRSMPTRTEYLDDVSDEGDSE